MSIIFLKVKVKHLAAEARIIRKEANKVRGDLKWKLNHHRTTKVREAARSANIAYALLLGRTYQQIEQNPRTEPNWKEIERLQKKYG